MAEARFSRTLIQAIQSRPALCDPQAAEYHDLRMKLKAWFDVGLDVITDFHLYSAADQVSQVQDLQEQWAAYQKSNKRKRLPQEQRALTSVRGHQQKRKEYKSYVGQQAQRDPQWRQQYPQQQGQQAPGLKPIPDAPWGGPPALHKVVPPPRRALQPHYCCYQMACNSPATQPTVCISLVNGRDCTHITYNPPMQHLHAAHSGPVEVETLLSLFVSEAVLWNKNMGGFKNPRQRADAIRRITEMMRLREFPQHRMEVLLKSYVDIYQIEMHRAVPSPWRAKPWFQYLHYIGKHILTLKFPVSPEVGNHGLKDNLVSFDADQPFMEKPEDDNAANATQALQHQMAQLQLCDTDDADLSNDGSSDDADDASVEELDNDNFCKLMNDLLNEKSKAVANAIQQHIAEVMEK